MRVCLYMLRALIVLLSDPRSAQTAEPSEPASGLDPELLQEHRGGR